MMTGHGGAEISILLIDDEQEVLESFELILNFEGYANTVSCRDSRQTMDILKGHGDIGAILLDLSMPGLGGEKLLAQLATQYPHLPVIIVTATNDLEIAVRCMRRGAFDYLVKPVEKMALIGSVRRALERYVLEDENRALKRHLMSVELEHPESFEHIITRNDRMLNIFRYCEAVAGSGEPILITGETGVGKELVARALHRLSGRNGRFVGVNIAGLDDNDFADTLFGHLRGAFTGADRCRDGLIRSGAKGTLFLDEIGDLGTSAQIKLLRLLQEHEFYPLGSDRPEKSSARIICATNCDLANQKMAQGFRRDLFYRLQTHVLHLPPLRDRHGDLPLLIEHFVNKAAVKLGKTAPHYPEELIALLSCHRFPGNIRELEAMVMDAVSRHGNRTLSLQSFREKIFPPDTTDRDLGDKEQMALVEASIFSSFNELPSLEKAGSHLVCEALTRTGGNQTLAARILGITQSALSQRLKKAKLSG